MATQVGPLPALSAGLPGGNTALLNATAAVVVKALPGIVQTLSCTAAGSFTINDCATTGTAAATNVIWSGALTLGQTVKLEWPCGTGITVSAATGTLALSYT
jgi:hypothetical protein